jgi:hypothetical protein
MYKKICPFRKATCIEEKCMSFCEVSKICKLIENRRAVIQNDKEKEYLKEINRLNNLIGHYQLAIEKLKEKEK